MKLSRLNWNYGKMVTPHLIATQYHIYPLDIGNPFANSEDYNEMQNIALIRSLHCLLRFKQLAETEVYVYLNFEILIG